MNTYPSTHEGKQNYVIHCPAVPNHSNQTSEEHTESAEQIVLDDSLTTEMTEILNCIVSMKNQLVELTRRVKSYEKASARRVKAVIKELNKKKARSAKPPSGFAKPVTISHELCDFMQCPYGTQLARTTVTKFISSYIKEQGLENKLNKKAILLDDRLGALFNLDEGTEIGYFSIQKHMNHHFSKGTGTVTGTGTTGGTAVLSELPLMVDETLGELEMSA